MHQLVRKTGQRNISDHSKDFLSQNLHFEFLKISLADLATVQIGGD